MPTWPAQTRSDAVALLRDGVGTREVARRLSVPHPTLSRWAKAAGLEPERDARAREAHAAVRQAWAQRRLDLVDQLGEATVTLLERTLTATDGPDARGWATALAILVDKAQLLSGQATSRHEVFDAERRRQHVLALADELAQRRQARGLEQPAQETG